ncbi:MAG: ABC-F family ATP-binding cassette domain-containing protein [Thermodesulfobacteriota bacterium]|jgi:ATP-binding cassette subfamily F protein 3|nr:MAG: ABC-F family ATP-binding cassette domain-containing protein [Thermodesulfobacteriota bacterium]
MISIQNITKRFGNQLLFDQVNFKINSRERVGLVGRNGHGKTTLFRIIVGEEPSDEGSVIIPRGYRIGYVRQALEFTEDTILQEGMKGLPEGERDHYWKVEKVLMGLGFSPADMKRPPREFSGGFQVRLNLAKVLVSDSDMLLLDEPTNYLDITSIRWVEHFLLDWPHELLLITHDRSLMDKLVTHTMGIHRQKIKKTEGDTEKYYRQIAQEEEIYEKTRIKDEQRRKEVELFITRFRAKARLANMVQSRIKTIEKMGKKEKLEQLKNLEFAFRNKPFQGKYVLGAQNISFAYDAVKPLIRNLSFTIKAGDRVCVMGSNGKGKTTLLKLLAGTLVPQGGEIAQHPGVTVGSFEQTNVKNLMESRTIEEELLASHASVDRQMARNICGAMMFGGDAALKKIEVLSGGEKSRVMLGKLLVTPVNLLLLDEPTNHLDMESSDALLEAIDSFEGAVLLVTHNEMFLHALAERLIVFDQEGQYFFEGSYQRFLEQGGWHEDEERRKIALKDNHNEESGEKRNKKEMRRKRSVIIAERAKVLNPVKRRVEQIEQEIEIQEQELNRLANATQEALSKHHGSAITELAQATHQSEKTVDTLFGELEKLTDLLKRQEAIFEEKLRQFTEQ